MEDGEFTSHQKHLKLKFKKMFGSGRKATLAYKLQLFKHELRACSETLKYKHKQINRKTINYRFSTDPKSVYRRMREKNVDVKSLPSLDSVETYWKTLWAEKSKFNAEAKWLPTLRHSYCPNAQQFNYEVTDTIVANILSKISSNKAPGPDSLSGIDTKIWNSMYRT